MINKYIKIEQGSYRNQDMSGRIFPIIKDYQAFAGKPGGFVTVDCSELDGFEGLDKARVNVPEIGALTIVPEGQYISHRDELVGRVNHVLKVVKENGFTSYENDVEIVE